MIAKVPRLNRGGCSPPIRSCPTFAGGLRLLGNSNFTKPCQLTRPDQTGRHANLNTHAHFYGTSSYSYANWGPVDSHSHAHTNPPGACH